MKKRETVEKLREFLKTEENRKSEKIIDFLVSCGLRPETKRTRYPYGTAIINDWEENISPGQWTREHERQADRD